MFVIKIKDKDLFYNNRNSHGFHDDINMADVFNSKKGASNSLNNLKRWYNVGLRVYWRRKEYHDFINDFDNDVEIREVKIVLC
jgi:hypothetical protein